MKAINDTWIPQLIWLIKKANESDAPELHNYQYS